MSLGKLHLVLLHLPIGLLLFACALEWLGHWYRRSDWSRAAHLALSAGVVSALLTAATGWLLAGEGGYERDLLDWHARLAYATLGTSVAAWWWRDTRAYRPLLLLSSVALVATGHFGGSLTHGRDFLFEKAAPNADVPPTAMALSTSTVDSQSVVYQTFIQPILEKKCWTCHREGKSKGNLRMDTPELLLRGGKHGVPFVAGQSAQSLMVQRARLPLHAEQHMPPAGKPQLTPDELALLAWWIDSGASFERTLAATPPSPDVAHLFSFEKNKPAPNPVWSLPMQPAAAQALAQLRGLRVAVTPLGAESPWLRVSYAGHRPIAPDALAALAGVAEQVVDLDFSNTPLDDASLAALPPLPHLARLHLAQTSVGDAGMAALAPLRYLEFLNLTGTHVTDAGLAHLTSKPHLRTVHTWGSGVSEAGRVGLQQQYPAARIEGAVPSLDTSSTPLALRPPKILLSRRVFDDTMLVALDYPKMVEVHYTLDGASPTTASPRYEGGPMVIQSHTHLRALATRPGWKDSPDVSERLYQRKIQFADIQLLTPPDPKYAAQGAKSLGDNVAAPDAAENTFLGYQGKDLEATIDLGKTTDVRAFHVHTFEGLGPWVYAPRGIEVWVSNDGKKWRSVFKKTYPITRSWEMRTFWIDENLRGVASARYVRMRLRNVGKNPAWHPNKGKPCWVFADEILLE
jgi:uncharacterized membrane protein